jgi:hypothetical protein
MHSVLTHVFLSSLKQALRHSSSAPPPQHQHTHTRTRKERGKIEKRKEREQKGKNGREENNAKDRNNAMYPIDRGVHYVPR